MLVKKLSVAALALASLPVVIILGSIIADFVYKRLLFSGYDANDMFPGDGAGESFLTWMSWAVLLLLDFAFWTRVYRRLRS